ncbi:hypothetical protein [uncultured Erythrobacter sp.]|uniref:hypothetical protein n=1 Tax=uncultured Erythrobacter sp. TaxID=263913 RepID=UPI002610A209|nr:hypothetical protein [uncultured Erythrobacter sp.]
MTFSFIAALITPFALQSATPAPAAPTSFADLPIEQTTAPRCGTAFAIVQGWQEAGDERGAAWPNMEEANAREFFLTAMVRLIDAYTLDRSDVTRLVEAEKARHQADNFVSVEAMMPACLALIEASSTKAR